MWPFSRHSNNEAPRDTAPWHTEDYWRKYWANQKAYEDRWESIRAYREANGIEYEV